jgi:uncharacterized protein
LPDPKSKDLLELYTRFRGSEMGKALSERAGAAGAAAASATSERARGRHGIRLRRFAGPGVYCQQMTPLKIAHLTDLHVGRITPFAVQQAAVRITNAEHPDLVVLTGDFVCHSQLYLDQLIEVMRGFSAPVVAVLGNHDHWSGADEVERALKLGGVEVLRNRNTTLTFGHQRLQLVGLDDAYTGHASRVEAVKGLRRDLPTLGLSHIAEEADGLWHEGIPLVLAGHTHGGQVTFAKLHELALGKIGGHRYVHGLYGSRGSRAASKDVAAAGAVYVGAGIGAAVMPLRIGERGKREVTIFELGVAPGTFDEHHGEQSAMPGRKPSQRVIDRRAATVVRKRLSRERKTSGS